MKSGKSFMGICMGAYLADKDWIGLIDAPLESEVARPGSDALDQEIIPCNLHGIISKSLFTIRMDLISTAAAQAPGSRRSLIMRMEISPLPGTNTEGERHIIRPASGSR